MLSYECIKPFSSFVKWNIKTSVYLKNQSLELDLKTLYKWLNYKKPNISYFKLLGTKACVNFPKNAQIRKLANWSWKDIFLQYDRTNRFRVYNLSTQKVHVVRDVDVDLVFLAWQIMKI